MRTVKLTFADERHLSAFIGDATFWNTIKYLNPIELSANELCLTDPIVEHQPLDTEMVVLSTFALAVQRVLDTAGPPEFLNPIIDQQKGGFAVDGTVIIKHTDLQLS